MSSDVDLRATLAHNVVLTGGTSSIPGLSDRLMTELNKILPSLKFRILTTGHTIERQYQSWLAVVYLQVWEHFTNCGLGKRNTKRWASKDCLTIGLDRNRKRC